MFITNTSAETSLHRELQKKLPYTAELKILVGYFYFTGQEEIIREIFKNKELRIQLLVGMNADVFNGNIVEYAEGTEGENQSYCEAKL